MDFYKLDTDLKLHSIYLYIIMKKKKFKVIKFIVSSKKYEKFLIQIEKLKKLKKLFFSHA